jgi:hypothetical protein
MREALFIFIVIGLLLCWTAIKYRRQIVSIIEFYKQVKAVRSKLQQTRNGPPNIDGARGIQLIKCSRCGKWVPQSEAVGDVSRPVCRSGCELTRRTN